MTPVTNHYLLDADSQIGRGLWSGIIAGFFISILVFWILSALGIAISGHSIANIARDELRTLSVGAGAWILGSAIIATFVGGYFCSRIVSYSSWRAGIGEGLVVSSIFFLFLAVQAGLGLVFVGREVLKTIELAAAGWFTFFASLLGSVGCCLGAVFGTYQNPRFGRTTAYKVAA